MRRCFHGTASFTTIVRDQATLAAIKALILVDNPLVKTAFAQGFALGLFCSFGYFERDDLCHEIATVIPANAGMTKNSLVQTRPFKLGLNPIQQGRHFE